VTESNVVIVSETVPACDMEKVSVKEEVEEGDSETVTISDSVLAEPEREDEKVGDKDIESNVIVLSSEGVSDMLLLKDGVNDIVGVSRDPVVVTSSDHDELSVTVGDEERTSDTVAEKDVELDRDFPFRCLETLREILKERELLPSWELEKVEE